MAQQKQGGEAAHYLDLFGLEKGERCIFHFERQYAHENVGKTTYMVEVSSKQVEEAYAKRTALEAKLKAANEAIKKAEEQHAAARCYKKSAYSYLDIIACLRLDEVEDEEPSVLGAVTEFCNLLETRYHEQSRVCNTLSIIRKINFVAATQGLTNIEYPEVNLMRLIRAFGKFSQHAQHLEESNVYYWKEFVILILRLSTPDTAFDKLKEASESWKLDPAKLQELIDKGKALRGEPEPKPPKRSRID